MKCKVDIELRRKAANPEKYKKYLKEWNARRFTVDAEFRAATKARKLKAAKRQQERKQIERAARILTEITGIPHEAAEIVDASGKKTWQPRPVTGD